MTKKTNLVKEKEFNKQGADYLSKIYSSERRPLTDYPEKLTKYLSNEVLRIHNGKVLDVGCGRGDILRAFQKINFEVTGIDLSEEAIELCKPIKVLQKDLENEEVNINQEYDVVFSKSLIEHLNNPLNFLRSCKKIVKSDGTVIIMTPSWFHHQFGPFYLDHTHIKPFTMQSLRDIGYLAGFNNVKVSYFYQLPIIWNYPSIKILSKIICSLKLPYSPMYDGMTIIKWPNEINKFIKFSREVMLLAVMKN